MTRLLIAYDGSDEAKQAIGALPWCDLPHQQVTALVLAPVQMWPPLPQSCFGRSTQQEGKLLRMARSLARLSMSEALAIARQGAAQVELLFPDWSIQAAASSEAFPGGLLKKAEEWGADRVLVSSTGLRRHGQLSPWRCVSDLRGTGALLGRQEAATGQASEQPDHGPSATTKLV